VNFLYAPGNGSVAMSATTAKLIVDNEQRVRDLLRGKNALGFCAAFKSIIDSVCRALNEPVTEEIFVYGFIRYISILWTCERRGGLSDLSRDARDVYVDALETAAENAEKPFVRALLVAAAHAVGDRAEGTRPEVCLCNLLYCLIEEGEVDVFADEQSFGVDALVIPDALALMEEKRCDGNGNTSILAFFHRPRTARAIALETRRACAALADETGGRRTTRGLYDQIPEPRFAPLWKVIGERVYDTAAANITVRTVAFAVVCGERAERCQALLALYMFFLYARDLEEIKGRHRRKAAAAQPEPGDNSDTEADTELDQEADTEVDVETVTEAVAEPDTGSPPRSPRTPPTPCDGRRDDALERIANFAKEKLGEDAPHIFLT
jgi:hypothetical protein